MKPNINIFEYPSLKLHRILRDGTEEAYAHLDFSPKGDKLASVGSAPDYMLTVWDWRNEQIILRSKAFSQDIYKVAFSPEDEGHLCTSGSGHIRCVNLSFLLNHIWSGFWSDFKAYVPFESMIIDKYDYRLKLNSVAALTDCF